MSTKVEVFTSPGWEAEVDTDWAEGLFAVFLRSAKGRRSGARAKATGKNQPSEGVILLTVRKDGEVLVEPVGPPRADVTPTSPSAETRRSRRPRHPDEGTAKLRDSDAPPAGSVEHAAGTPSPAGSGRTGTGRRAAPRTRVAAPPPPPPPPPPPSSARRPIPPAPPPTPPRTRTPGAGSPPPPRTPAAAAPTPARPPRATATPSPQSRTETVRDASPPEARVTVPAAAGSTPLDDEGIHGFLLEMGALVKYGHAAQVRAEFDKRMPQHAEDPRFRRLAIDFYFEHGMAADGIDALFGLASLYFDRHDMPKMRECLDEILRHEPSSRRARKMRELLDKRPGRSRAPTSPGR